ncbi:MAG: PhoX family protein [Gammaproteobacteria bacterium]|nr:PhoX family protein [Gammaproteobacteria bacterium]MDH3362562.1 PhoX family protein [Gammaproteobacteria bacterium]MDH3481341.1 PhoX family protein [Gammaproteobacteria bacterium]
MLNRRRFIQSIAAAAAAPAVTPSYGAAGQAADALRPDPDRILDLPDGFSYRVVSRVGDIMSDGLRVPGAHDGMAAFAGPDGRVILVCNHEMTSHWVAASAFGDHYGELSELTRSLLYDRGGDRTPALGGTTTTLYDPAAGRTEKQFLSLAGTEVNCAGGPTPWGSWLSCEECFQDPGTRLQWAGLITRDQQHGYVFEVPSQAAGLVAPKPIKAMGRFEHEACAVHAATGIVYMTEDRFHSLFYRYIPNTPGKLLDGGRLQALAIDGHSSVMTHNWAAVPQTPLNEPMKTHWIDLDDVDPIENDLRLRGASKGAATFARGEGLCVADDRFAFTCTIGGPARIGQVFTYTPSPAEGTPAEKGKPGLLTLIAEADENSLLRNCDNLTMAPWGDLIVCEDTLNHCGLVGIRPDGSQYEIADNPYSGSELAGACFSPDGKILFVNIQYPGMTIAITGPWPT